MAYPARNLEIVNALMKFFLPDVKEFEYDGLKISQLRVASEITPIVVIL